MVKPGVYSVDAEKDGKKDSKDDLKKLPLADPTFAGVVKILPENASDRAPRPCCTLRRVLLLLLALMLVFLAVGVGIMTYHLLSRDGLGHHNKSKFDLHVTYEDDDANSDKHEGDRPVDHVPVPDATDPPRPYPVTRQRFRPTTTTMRATTVSLETLDEEIEIGDETEKFEIPSGDGCERVTIMHDFTAMISAYRMWESELCFVKQLDLQCMPPWMLEMQMSNPDYLRQHFTMIRENYLAVPPAITDVYTLGPFVGDLCYGVPTYWLEEDIEGTEEPDSDSMGSELYESSDSDTPPDTPGSDSSYSWWQQRPPLPPHRGRRAAKVETNKETKIRYWDSSEKVKEMTIHFKVDE